MDYVFLSNTRNKQNIIIFFTEILVKEKFKTIHTPDDAGTLIARTALSCSKEKQVKVIGEIIDILVLLWHCVNKDVHEVMFQPGSRTWNIQNLIDNADHMKKAILLTHAFLGCNTVSRIYGNDKNKITKFPKLIFVVMLLQYFIIIYHQSWTYKKQGESYCLAYITELI